MESTREGQVLQDFIRHQLLATAWVRYNSRTGRATERQVVRVMNRLSASELVRMLAARNIHPLVPDYETRAALRAQTLAVGR